MIKIPNRRILRGSCQFQDAKWMFRNLQLHPSLIHYVQQRSWGGEESLHINRQWERSEEGKSHFHTHTCLTVCIYISGCQTPWIWFIFHFSSLGAGWATCLHIKRHLLWTKSQGEGFNPSSARLTVAPHFIMQPQRLRKKTHERKTKTSLNVK